MALWNCKELENYSLTSSPGESRRNKYTSLYPRTPPLWFLEEFFRQSLQGKTSLRSYEGTHSERVNSENLPYFTRGWMAVTLIWTQGTLHHLRCHAGEWELNRKKCDYEMMSVNLPNKNEWTPGKPQLHCFVKAWLKEYTLMVFNLLKSILT